MKKILFKQPSLILLLSLFILLNGCSSISDSSNSQKPETSKDIPIYYNTEGADNLFLVDAHLNIKPLEENFEKSVKGNIDKGEIKYIDGKEGFGFIDVYKDNPNGGKIRANILTYDNTRAQYIHPSSGTIEFWVKPLDDVISNTDSHGFFHANAFSIYSWEIGVYQSQLVVYRDFIPCIRSINRINYKFNKGEWYKLSLMWRGDQTKFYINNKEIGKFRFEGIDFLPPSKDFIAAGDDIFVIDNLWISADTKIPINEMTLEDSKNFICPNLNKLLSENVQETYKGIELHNFPDQEIRDKIKSFIDLLLPNMIDSTNHIILVEDKQYELSHGTATADFRLAGKAMFLKKSSFDSVAKLKEKSKNFFHEAGHAYAYTLNIGYGGPNSENKRKEWAEISGIGNYAGECSSPTEFIIKDGFLTAYGSTTPDEDLAEWVGITYDLYYNGETFSDLLNPQSNKYYEENKKKIDFLLAKEFINDEIYFSVTNIKKNSKKYLIFND